VILQAFAPGLASNQIVFNVTGQGDCGGDATFVPPTGSGAGDGFGDAPFGLALAGLLIVLGVGVVTGRRRFRVAVS
jgi:hypothetical protein